MGRCVKKWNLNPIWADMKHPFWELAGGMDALPTPETESSDERTAYRAYPNRRGRGRRRGRLMSVGRSLMDEEVETSSLGNGTSLRRSLARARSVSPHPDSASFNDRPRPATATRASLPRVALPSLPPLHLVALVPLLNLSQGQIRSIPSILTLLPWLD